MSQFCSDRDLLCIEPIVFVGGGFSAQQLTGGTDGVLAATSFRCESADFVAAGIAPGMVLCVWTTTASEGRACEIVETVSPTELRVSVLRADANAAAVAPQDGSALQFHVRTYGPQIAEVSRTLAEKLRQISETAGIAPADFMDSAQLRMTVTFGALESIFVARSASAAADDPNWTKALYYRDLFRRQQVGLRLAVDANGDGVAEQTRTLGNVTLRRS